MGFARRNADARASGDVRQRWSAPLRLRNYRAAAHSLHTYVRPLDGLRRYALGRGDFPAEVALRTRLGKIQVHLPHAHDIRTVNEIFCRRDYGSGRPATVLDLGANIGVAALFFLTRREDTVVHCVEPHPGNLEVLRHNLEPFADRVVVHPVAVAPESGTAEFVADPVGRYSGLASHTPHEAGRLIEVPTRAIDELVQEVADQVGRVDLLKVDTEGSEPLLLEAIRPETRRLVDAVVWEDDGQVRHERWSG